MPASSTLQMPRLIPTPSGKFSSCYFHSRRWWHSLLGCKGSCRPHREKQQVARKINRKYMEPGCQRNFFSLCSPQQSLRLLIPGFGKQLVSNGCREQSGSELIFQRGSGVMQGVFLRAVNSPMGAGLYCLPQSLVHPHPASRGAFKKSGEGHFGRASRTRGNGFIL